MPNSGDGHSVRPALYPFTRPLRERPVPLKIVLLGATGSIGRQTLEVVRAHPQRLRIVGMGCHSRIDGMLEMLGQLQEIQPGDRPLVAVTDRIARERLAASGADSFRLVRGDGNAQVELVRTAEADCLVNGLVGAVGLEPTLAAAHKDLRIALANKETLVMGGDLVAAAVAAGGAEVLPVDSEHAAIAQCLSGRPADEVRRLILTASGGPFRETPAAKLDEVTVAEVLDHPTWKMGPKITVDSATLMNKGLEIIEAHHLFSVAYDHIDVVVHPGSTVHSLVEFADGAMLAQMGTPDMRLPLQYAINGQHHWPLDCGRLDLASLGTLRFEKPDTERFPCLALARAAGRVGGSAPVVLNAANEIAVAALLAGRIRFNDIGAIVAEALAREPDHLVPDLEAVLETDSRARALTGTIVNERSR